MTGEAHPQTSQATGRILADALRRAGAPAGVFALVHAFDAGPALISDPRIKAGAFTDSSAGGRALFDRASSRPDPIPYQSVPASLLPVELKD